MVHENTSPKPARKKNLHLGILILITSVLLIGIVTAIRAHRKQPIICGPPIADPIQESEFVEQLVIEERFTNSKQEATFHYDTQIYIQVKRKHLSKVLEKFQNMSVAITADVADIFRLANPSYMHEDALQTLTRQIKEVLDNRLLDESKKSMVEKVLITRCTELKVE